MKSIRSLWKMNDYPGNNFEYIVNEEDQNLRIDQFLAQKNTQYSRSYFQKLIKNEKVTVNGLPVKPSVKISEGDEIFLNIPLPKKWHLQPEEIPIDIVYEDPDILVVNKLAGMVVHPGAGVWNGTLVNALLHHCGGLSTIGGIVRPGIVHRLDKNTSGLLVVAKNDKTHMFLQNQFKDRSISRKYMALVWGKMPEQEGCVEGDIARSTADRKKMAVVQTGKEALTRYKVISEFPFCSLLEVQLATGRTHQIRVHMKHTHHPVIGDPEYNGRETQISGLKGEYQKHGRQILKMLDFQFLHAFHLQFFHPETKEPVEFTAPLPENLQHVISFLRDL